ncbi:hypothetical protein A2118_00845 [Candidatus Kaiserbacteria bacterium GWA2_50_9]|uniref:HIT domain-containing protein n=1 Tax=Candidatus Kaiserbacteria bacterium GWA2_50_9 TaxID=1798474 RepID=A0A1F6BUI0_9BACT|nr:MAG: hypothetical protein A2118_00845 [Candidatus Kaiserbacteria bacterium GWA2_50_9]
MKIKDTSGAEHDIECIACAIQSGKVTLLVERIAETEFFVAEQDFEYPIEAFIIVASKRHVKSILGLSEEERADLTSFLFSCRKAMKTQLGIVEVTFVQEEHSSSSHFHVWLFPWLPWMDEEGYKRKVSEITTVMKMAKDRPMTEESSLILRESAQKLKSEIAKDLKDATKRSS